MIIYEKNLYALRLMLIEIFNQVTIKFHHNRSYLFTINAKKKKKMTNNSCLCYDIGKKIFLQNYYNGAQKRTWACFQLVFRNAALFVLKNTFCYQLSMKMLYLDIISNRITFFSSLFSLHKIACLVIAYSYFASFFLFFYINPPFFLGEAAFCLFGYSFLPRFHLKRLDQ